MFQFELKQNRTKNSHTVRPVRSDRTNPQQARDGDSFLVRQQALGNQTILRFAQSCPLALPSASICPFGGVCHTCPAKVQTKLKIGQPGDKYEQEADRVADEVMRMPDPKVAEEKAGSGQAQGPRIQRICTECEEELHRQPIEEEEEEELQAKPLSEQITPLIQRQVEEEEEEEEEEELQMKQAEGHTPTMTSNIHNQINGLHGTGKPLSQSVRSFFEPRLGYDFSRIRIHTNDLASETAKALNSRAFTLGRDIVFGRDQYAPDTREGKRLLAHELTHVVQQKAARRQSRKNWSLVGHPLLPIFITPCPGGIRFQRQPVINAHPASSSVSDIDHSRNSAEIGVLAGAGIAYYGLTHHRIRMHTVPDTMPRRRGGSWEVALWSAEIFPNVDNTIYVTRDFPDRSCPYNWTLDHEAGHVIDAYAIMVRQRELLINDLRSVRPEPNNPTVAANAAEANRIRQQIRARVAMLVNCAMSQACYDMYRSDYARDVREYPRAFTHCPAPRPPVPRAPPRGRVVVRCRRPPRGCPRAVRLFP